MDPGAGYGGGAFEFVEFGGGVAGPFAVEFGFVFADVDAEAGGRGGDLGGFAVFFYVHVSAFDFGGNAEAGFLDVGAEFGDGGDKDAACGVHGGDGGLGDGIGGVGVGFFAE